MTPKELNRDIKRLAKMVARDPETLELTPEFVREFKRLYQADRTFQIMNASSIRIMLRLNLRHRIEPLHMFGIYIEL